MPAKPANEMITDFGVESAVITGPEPKPSQRPSASACEPHRDFINLGLSSGCNAMAIRQNLWISTAQE
jgi:hypothetical protein